MMMGYDGWGDGDWLAICLAMMVVLALVAVAAVALVRWGRAEGGRAATGGRDAEQILAARYARGEIDEQDYHWRLAVLTATSVSGASRGGTAGSPGAGA